MRSIASFSLCLRFVFFLFIFTSLTGCDSKKSIVGKWVPIDMEMPNVAEETKRNMLSQVSLEFKENNSYVSTAQDGHKRIGTYNYDGDAKTITLHPKENLNDILKIQTLGKTNMTVEFQGLEIKFVKK
ncbi:MAG: lipocalin family protein [Flavisolibacter sp.]